MGIFQNTSNLNPIGSKCFKTNMTDYDDTSGVKGIIILMLDLGPSSLQK